ncbi:MAG: DsrE family protein [Acidobacteriota bacterium]
MTKISIILRKAPYGSVDAPEAIRHALGGINDDMSVNLVFIGSGVNAARLNQDILGTNYLSVEDGIRDCIDMGVAVFAETKSLDEEQISDTDLIEGVLRAGLNKIGEVLKTSGTVMIF